MLLLKYFCFFVIRIALFMFLSSITNAKILELGESQVRGTKDQPEAITFISRARPDLSILIKEISFKNKIVEEINNSKIFDISYTHHSE